MKTFTNVSLAMLFLQISCIFSNYEEQHRQQIQNQIDSLSALKGQQGDSVRKLDYGKLNISKDSLDIKLYELIDNSQDIDEETILKNIDILIQKGAKPDALVEITYSVRKPGSYIPIIKEFYNNKYREYTTATTAVHAAAASGKINIMKKLIGHGAKVNIINADNFYPIDIAIKKDDSKMVNYLVEAGADLKKANLGMSENIDLIEQLVKAGANPKTININFALNDKVKLKRLLAMKPDINKTELDFGTIMGDDELFDLLVGNGLSPNTQGKFPDACPAIISAIKYDNFRAFKKLHAMGADLHVICRAGFGETPLQTAIYYQRIDILKYLIANKVSPNEMDWTGKSALYKACYSDNDQIINILIDAGADMEYYGYFDNTPLMEAANSGKYISAQTLINRKANVNFKNKYGETPLVLAVKKNDLPMIKLLVESGAKTNITFKSKTLVEFAQEGNAPPMIIEYLKKHAGN
jgi:ankyrin repeat protein